MSNNLNIGFKGSGVFVFLRDMAGGAGHIYDMISRMRSNSNLLNKPGYFKMKEAYLKVSRKENLIYKKASPAELQRIRNKIIRAKRAETMRMLSVVIVSIIAVAILFAGSVYFLGKYLI